MTVWQTLCLASVLAIGGVPAQGQSAAPALAGFKYVAVIRPTYTDGSVDRMQLAPYLEELLRQQGWSILAPEEAKNLAKPSMRQVASQFLLCGLGHTEQGFTGTTANLQCDDFAGTRILNFSVKGDGFTQKGQLQTALRAIARSIQKQRPAFDASKTVDIFSRFPAAETVTVNEAQIDTMISTGRLSEAIAGIWAATDESGYRIGIVKSESSESFVAVVLDSPENVLWQPGMVKGRLTQAADGATFAGRWRLGNRSEVPVVATLKGAILTLRLRVEAKEEELKLLKLRPSISETAVEPAASSPRISSTGTGFLCAPGTVATSYHVVEGGKDIQIYLPVLGRSLKLRLTVSDAANDLALLAVVDDERTINLPYLAVADFGTVKLGANAVALGFPLGTLLGNEHKVTAGLVSGLDGLAGDPRMFQFTAPIQPGSSGSPLFDESGRVIGIATASLNSGSARDVPQNVNFAVKSDYLALLLKRVPPGARAAGAQPVGKTVSELVERVKASVGQIRVSR